MEIFILLFLILLNAFIVMCEMALVSAKKSRIEMMANKGDRKAQTVLNLKENPEIFLSTTQIYITLIAILTGVYSGERFSIYLQPYIEKIDLLKPYADTISTTIIVIIVTFLSILLGELIPKRIALMNPEKIAKGVAGPINTLSTISYPLVWLLSKMSSGFFTLFNIKKSSDTQVTEEEIKAMINEGSELGAIEEEEKDIIERVFHLGDRNITSIMTHRTDIIWFDVNEERSSVKQKIKEFQHSVYPICSETIDNIEGTISVKDLYLKPDAALKDLKRKA
jgi:putative hemolysin